MDGGAMEAVQILCNMHHRSPAIYGSRLQRPSKRTRLDPRLLPNMSMARDDRVAKGMRAGTLVKSKHPEQEPGPAPPLRTMHRSFFHAWDRRPLLNREAVHTNDESCDGPNVNGVVTRRVPAERPLAFSRTDRCRFEVVTTAMSLISDPGDEGTNTRYRDLIENIEGMLDKLPQDHHVWTHLLGDGTERESMADETTLTTAAMGAARQATNAELLRLGTHTVEYLTAMRKRTEQAIKDGGTFADEFGSSACNTDRTEPAARVATAALIDAATAVAVGTLDTAFVIAKPPTHHAVGNANRCRGRSPRNLAFGFCHINGISAAAAAVIDAQPGARIVILDVDVHHGNGNEDTWYGASNVLHISLSEAGVWPGGDGGVHGDPTHIGSGRGRGFNFNYPMEVGEGDPAYVWALLEHVIPRLIEFQPTLLFIACGFDALKGDPYASMELSPPWFGWLAARLREEAIAPLVFNMEGGYNPETCAHATKLTIDGLNGSTSSASFLKAMGLAPAGTRDGSYVLTSRGTAFDPRGFRRRASHTRIVEPNFVRHLAHIERCQNNAISDRRIT